MVRNRNPQEPYGSTPIPATATPSRRRVRPGRRMLAAATVSALALAGVVTAVAPSAAAKDHRPGDRPSRTVPLPAGLQPEGITSGPGTRYYVGSLADGRIVTGDLRRGGPSTVLLPGATGRQIRGLFWDRRSGLLWAVGNQGPAREPGTASKVWAVDSRTGAVVRDWTIAGGAFLNDLVVTRTAVWVTDSGVDRLTRISVDRHGRPTPDAPTSLPLTGEWPATPAGANGANGIRTLPDGDLLLDNSTAGGLWAADRRTGEVTRIPVRGTQLTGGDGLLRDGRTVYVVRGTGQAVVDVLTLKRARHHGWTADYRRGLTDPTLDVPSTATLAGGSLWAVNARFGNPAPDTADYFITRLPIR
jgi:hypothetical protein